MMTSENLTEVGVDRRYWYPAARVRELQPNRALPVSLWNERIVIFRGEASEVTALEDRCAHRLVALHPGSVCSARIACPYHGWEYDQRGKLTHIPYWDAEKPLPKVALRAYPTVCKSGLIWVYCGGKAEANPADIPDTSAWDDGPWMSFNLDHHFRNHFAIGVINGMDYFHFFLHRRYQPWSKIRLANVRSDQDKVEAEYEILLGKGRSAGLLKRIFGERREELSQHIRVRYEYPFHTAEMGDEIKVWAFFQPVDSLNTRAFITMYLRGRGLLPGVKLLFAKLFRPFVLTRIQKEDAWAGTLEQEAWRLYPQAVRHELNPVSVAVEKLILAKWREYQEAAVG